MKQHCTTFEHLYDWTIADVERRLDDLTMLFGYHFNPDDVRTVDTTGSLHFRGERGHDIYHLYLSI